MNFKTFLADIAKKHKSKTAISYNGSNISYNELYEKSLEFASGLLKHGLKKGKKVGILMHNSPEFVISFFGIIIAGGIAVPINPFFIPEEVEYILRHSEANYFISSNDFYEYIEYVNKNIDDVHLIIAKDYTDPFGKIIKFKKLYKPGNANLPELKEDKPCAIVYSSGTEGFIKGALMSHKNLLSNAEACKVALKVSGSDKLVTYLPLYHPFTLTVGLLMMFFAGGSIILIKNNVPFKKMVKTVFLKRATIFVGIPHVFNLLSATKAPLLFKFVNPVKYCISGGSPLPLEVLKKFEKKYKVPIIEGYGLIEAGPVVSLNPPSVDERKAGSVGKPIPSVKVNIIDMSTKKPVANNEIGEIAIKGSGIMLEYYKDKSATKNAFYKGWLLTGDLGKFDSDGFLYMLDRKSELINTSEGIAIARNLEELLHQHPEIEECAIVGLTGKSKEQTLTAVLVPKKNSNINPKDVNKFLKEKNSKHFPAIIEFWDELPRSSTGKILKREIKKIINDKNQS